MLDMIAKDLLEILGCPACKQPLEYRENPENLKCKACHRVYPVKDDIPIMLVDEATTVDESEHARLMAKAEKDGLSTTLGPGDGPS